jgi:hypothetical protein
MMVLGEASALGVFGEERKKQKVTFSLTNKPYTSDPWFGGQHLAVSVALFGGNDTHTFHPPYVPDWHEYYARNMRLGDDQLRIEPERIGLIVEASENDAFLYALPVTKLITKLFDAAGLEAKLSSGGLITQQLISRMGGLPGVRPFKIPGVRRLLKTFGPREPFTRNTALGIIGRKDHANPYGSFEAHKSLYIEPRNVAEPHLTPGAVFGYLVEKGLFRIGASLTCPVCSLENWIALDTLKQENVCDMCGATFDSTRQLVNGVFHYRRTGVLGLERNNQGAVPVALLLQQLDANLSFWYRQSIFSASYELKPKSGVELPRCEVDFVVVLPETFPERTGILIGECKDEGIGIDQNDIDNLRRVADAIPEKHFKTFILLAKLAEFTAEEIALARTLNGPYQRRVIMLTNQELEPRHIFERFRSERSTWPSGSSPEELATVTSMRYFS